MFDFLVPCRFIGGSLGRMAPLPRRPEVARIYSRRAAVFSGHGSVGFDFAREKENDYKYL
jgi:hypothetical protein